MIEDLVNELFKEWFQVQEIRTRLQKQFNVYGMEVIFVHELTRCKLKADYMRNVKTIEEFREITLKSNFNLMIIGSIIDRGIKDILKEKKYKLYMKRLTITNKDLDIDFLILGTPDIVKNSEVIEVKYTVSKLPKLKPAYEIQGKIYGWLLEVPEVKILVINGKGLMNIYTVKSFTEKEMKEHILNWWKKQPLHENECKYCPFKNYCIQVKH